MANTGIFAASALKQPTGQAALLCWFYCIVNHTPYEVDKQGALYTSYIGAAPPEPLFCEPEPKLGC